MFVGKFHKVSAFVWIADGTNDASGINVEAMSKMTPSRLVGDELKYVVDRNIFGCFYDFFGADQLTFVIRLAVLIILKLYF